MNNLNTLATKAETFGENLNAGQSNQGLCTLQTDSCLRTLSSSIKLYNHMPAHQDAST